MLEGERIYLRTLRKDDIEAFVQNGNKMESKGEFLPLNISNLVEAQRRFDETGFLGEDNGRFLIIEKGTDRVIGYVLYFKTTHYMSCYEIGYAVYLDSDRGKGYCSEATNLLTNWMFLAKEMNRLQICMDVRNTGSRRVAEKCGFLHEGVLRGAVYSRGEYHDLDILSMTRADFRKRQEEKKYHL